MHDRPNILLITTDPEEAFRRGWRVRWWDFLFYLSFGVTITFSVEIGGILTTTQGTDTGLTHGQSDRTANQRQVFIEKTSRCRQNYCSVYVILATQSC